MIPIERLPSIPRPMRKYVVVRDHDSLERVIAILGHEANELVVRFHKDIDPDKAYIVDESSLP